MKLENNAENILREAGEEKRRGKRLFNTSQLGTNYRLFIDFSLSSFSIKLSYMTINFVDMANDNLCGINDRNT